ncbi:DUF262 domain-containing protein [Candidatus Marithrix sp. Canyon 246]|uniref:DUF262 domain-containing protein n=1 Tax=Candidatus Marithrix sp. Canyon 246 TaxID=1827136 RepID=UPI000849F6D7|nr:DUF262 domain-containing protein [Candidatus Marithrix sp. Canyon 246]
MQEDEEDLDDIYPDARVKISKEQFSIYDLKRQYDKRQKIIIAPNFQRKDVWKPKQKSELIESVLMGIPIPIMYFFEDKDGKRQVVDGRQRLTTFFSFIDGGFKLNNLKILKEQNGKGFKDLELVHQAMIEDYQLFIYVIQPPTPENVKFEIFDRVNRGGTQLKPQEMRNALYQGKATKLLDRLVKFDCFKQATNNGIKDERMKDKHFVLRFLSFYMLYENWLDNIEYKSDIDDFLAKAMEFLNKSNDDIIEKIEHIFKTAMLNSYKIIGENGFRFGTKEGKATKRITMALFEIIAYLFSNKDIGNLDKDLVKKEVEHLKSEFEQSGTFLSRIDSSTNVAYRFNKIKELREKLLS